MGGLWKKMKVTTVLFIIGALALAGTPLMSGFYSKDLILESLLHAATHDSALYWVPLTLCVAAVGLTSYYMGRVIFLAFFGPLSEKSSHAHESGPAMLLPMVLLAIGSIFIGFGGPQMASLYGDTSYHFAVFAPPPVGLVALALWAGGFGLAYLIHVQGIGKGIESALQPVGDFIRMAPIDRAWEFGYRQVLLVGSNGVGWFDRYVIDGLMNASGGATLVMGERIRTMQTGRVGDYVYTVALAVLGLVAFGQIMLIAGGS
jgi:NADH-quinone oxidoreductase subunit L